MPVGTAGTVKGVQQRDLKADTNAYIILGNTYHLNLRPGTDLLIKAGGLHGFMNWDRPILTDSGGYQVYSLADTRKIKEEGVYFRSHIDGSKRFLSPETSMDIQRAIGADIIMAFDECTPYPCEKRTARKSMEMTHRWLKRCITHLDSTPSLYGYEQHLFPIVQGSTYPDLRKESAEFIASANCPGNAIGGLSVGEPAEDMYEMTEAVCDILPDCVMPTRNARNGMLFTSEGIINIRNEKWKDDLSPIDPYGVSYVDNDYSKAYLRHLMISKEMLGAQIATLHNIGFYVNLLREARSKITDGTFRDWKNNMIQKLGRRL